MTDARTTFISEENKLLRSWIKELIQERDSLRQELIDMRDDIHFSTLVTTRSIYSPSVTEDLPF